MIKIVDYKEFVEFHTKHPDLDNTEYYAEFPDVNKSTIRSWKSRVSKPKIETPLPTPAEADRAGGYDDELVKLLCTQTNTPFTEFEGIDTKNALLILKNKMKGLQLKKLAEAELEKKPDRGSNTSILPSPKPIGSNTKQFGLDPYIEFDLVKDEIRMEIPWDVLFDPDKNKALGEVKK